MILTDIGVKIIYIILHFIIKEDYSYGFYIKDIFILLVNTLLIVSIIFLLYDYMKKNIIKTIKSGMIRLIKEIRYKKGL